MSKPRRVREAMKAEPSGLLARETGNHPARFHSKRACHAQALRLGDCGQVAVHGGLYCYYHDKLWRELTTPRRQDSYAVWPLPDFPWRPVGTTQRIA